jgi:hypothetical protein
MRTTNEQREKMAARLIEYVVEELLDDDKPLHSDEWSHFMFVDTGRDPYDENNIDEGEARKEYARVAKWLLRGKKYIGKVEAERDALKEEVRRLREVPQDDHGWYDVLKERDALRAENERLKAELDIMREAAKIDPSARTAKHLRARLAEAERLLSAASDFVGGSAAYEEVAAFLAAGEKT